MTLSTQKGLSNLFTSHLLPSQLLVLEICTLCLISKDFSELSWFTLELFYSRIS